MDQLICASLSHTHNYWYDVVGMLKVPAAVHKKTKQRNTMSIELGCCCLKKKLNASRLLASPRQGEKHLGRCFCCLKKNLNASKPSEHPRVRGEKISKRLGCGIFFLHIQNCSDFYPVPPSLSRKQSPSLQLGCTKYFDSEFRTTVIWS